MDTRPLTGEPLALDLVNTQWVAGGRRRDLLATDDGMASWLAEVGMANAPARDDTRVALTAARAAVRAVLETPGSAGARAALNAVLDRGRVRRWLHDDGPRERAEVDDAAWEPAWRAAADLLDLLARAPDRVRRCGNPECVLYFLDTSKNGSRRWCAMATCGNRLKARRHQHRAGQPPAPPRPGAGT